MIFAPTQRVRCTCVLEPFPSLVVESALAPQLSHPIGALLRHRGGHLAWVDAREAQHLGHFLFSVQPPLVLVQVSVVRLRDASCSTTMDDHDVATHPRQPPDVVAHLGGVSVQHEDAPPPILGPRFEVGLEERQYVFLSVRPLGPVTTVNQRGYPQSRTYL